MRADSRWSGLKRILSRPSPFGNETGKLPIGEFSPSEGTWKTLHTAKVLVVGAGGLGCEILKDLALSGITQIHVVDLDSIDISNLNRQFLFREADVRRGKAEVAAEFVRTRVPGCEVTPHCCRIETLSEEFYRQFKVVVSGLDNIEARRWLNSMLVSLVEYDEEGDPDPGTIIPLVDGGTEGLKGQARVIVPKITSCFECSLESFPPPVGFPLCTISHTPRNAEHCIAYAFVMEWPKHFPDRPLDTDSPDDMGWVHQQALKRAEQFGIDGVTYFRTLGVVKNIIPAVASTNAVLSAACVTEVLKLLTFSAQTMNTYFMYMGSQGLYTHTFEYAAREQCLVCGDQGVPRDICLPASMTLRGLMDRLADDAAYRLKRPSFATADRSLYLQQPPSLEVALRPNLDQPLGALLESGDVVTITDPSLLSVSLLLQVELHP